MTALTTVIYEEDDDLFDTSDELESLGMDNEEESILNKCRGQTRRRLVLSFKSDVKVADNW